MNAVGWAYWLKDHWHLCADEPVSHEVRQPVFLAENVDALLRENAALCEVADVAREFNNEWAAVYTFLKPLREALARAEASRFVPGDRVWVDDPALAELRRIMREATGEEPRPNHHGTVEKVEHGQVMIVFDDGGSAPYPPEDTHRLDAQEATR